LVFFAQVGTTDNGLANKLQLCGDTATPALAGWLAEQSQGVASKLLKSSNNQATRCGSSNSMSNSISSQVRQYFWHIRG